MKHSKENLKIGTRYHIGENLVGTYIGKGVDGDINFSVNVGVQVRHFSIRPNNQKEYYKVCLFGQYYGKPISKEDVVKLLDSCDIYRG